MRRINSAVPLKLQPAPKRADCRFLCFHAASTFCFSQKAPGTKFILRRPRGIPTSCRSLCRALRGLLAALAAPDHRRYAVNSGILSYLTRDFKRNPQPPPLFYAKTHGHYSPFAAPCARMAAKSLSRYTLCATAMMVFRSISFSSVTSPCTAPISLWRSKTQDSTHSSSVQK